MGKIKSKAGREEREKKKGWKKNGRAGKKKYVLHVFNGKLDFEISFSNMAITAIESTVITIR